jgi:hypothetical protein
VGFTRRTVRSSELCLPPLSLERKPDDRRSTSRANRKSSRRGRLLDRIDTIGIEREVVLDLVDGQFRPFCSVQSAGCRDSLARQPSGVFRSQEHDHRSREPGDVQINSVETRGARPEARRRLPLPGRRFYSGQIERCLETHVLDCPSSRPKLDRRPSTIPVSTDPPGHESRPRCREARSGCLRPRPLGRRLDGFPTTGR